MFSFTFTSSKTVDEGKVFDSSTLAYYTETNGSIVTEGFVGTQYDTASFAAAFGIRGTSTGLDVTVRSSPYKFRSTYITISYDVVGGISDVAGAQVACVHYVDTNNWIAGIIQRADYAWNAPGGDLTLTIVKKKAGAYTELGYLYFAGRNTSTEPTKWLSLSILPSNKRADGLWPITVQSWSNDANDSTQPQKLVVYDRDVGDGAYFDINKGFAATGNYLPSGSTGRFGYSLSSVSYASLDEPTEIGAAYSLETNKDSPLEPYTITGLQGITLSAPFTQELITKVTYQVSSSADASDWSEWEDLAAVTVLPNTDGAYIHRTISNTTYFRYRAIYEYVYQGVTKTTAPSDYVVAGLGVITPGGLDQLPGGVVLPIQKPGEGPDPTSDQALRWVDPSSKILVGSDYARIRGMVGTRSLVATRALSVFSPATPLYEQAVLELEGNAATPLIRVRAGNQSKMLINSLGDSDFAGGGGAGDVGTGRLFFFI